MFALRSEDLEFLENAPLSLTFASTAMAPAKAVFDALSADASTWPSWFGAVSRAEYGGPAPYGVGALRRVHLVGGVTFHETVIAWDDPTRYGYRVDRTTLPGFRAMIEEWNVLETTDGTRVRWTMAVDAVLPVRIALRAAAPGVGLAFRRAVSVLDRQLTASG
jgi:hypothetical protein